MLNTININLKTDIKTDSPTTLPIKIMSQDKNNNQFILRFTNGGEAVALDDTYTVEVLTKFEKSGASRLTTAKVRQDYATWKFDTAYITQDETVYNYVYVRKSGSLVVSADSNAFHFEVGLSEIDKGAGKVAETYDENYQKHLDEFKGNVDFEEIAQAEQARKEAEILREESYEQKVDTALIEADVVGKVDNKAAELTSGMNEITSQLAQKVGGGNLATLDDLDSEVISAIEGGEGTSFNLLSIPKDSSVTPDKTTFFRKSKNLFDKDKITDGYYVNQANGILMPASGHWASEAIEVEGDTSYTISHYGNARTRVFWYDEGQANINGRLLDGRTFTSPSNARYLRFSIDYGNAHPSEFQLEEGSVSTDYEEHYNRIPIEYLNVPSDISMLSDGETAREWVKDKLMVKSSNIFDGSQQTEDTILDEHFISAGILYPDRPLYFVTAPIPVKPHTTYSVNEKIWGTLGEQVAINMMSSDGTYKGGHNTQTFTTLADVDYIQITVVKSPYTVDWIKKNFMIVEGNTPPTSYEPYGHLLPDFLKGDSGDSGDSGVSSAPIYVHVKRNTVNEISLGYKYDRENDMVVTLINKGPNSLFDFSSRKKVVNSSLEVTKSTIGQTVASNGTDFFGPYVMRAVNNKDGDFPDSLSFTGGNHGYDGGGSTQNNSATANEISFEIKINGKEIEEDVFSGYANVVDIYWTNLVQASNTKKENGDGRGVLEERYHLRFDGDKFDVSCDIVALEDIELKTYYGLQAVSNGFSGGNYYYKGGQGFANVYSVGSLSSSPDKTYNAIVYDNGEDRMELGVFDNFGLSYFTNNKLTDTSSFTTADKSYFNFIRAEDDDNLVPLEAGKMMFYKGYYKFKPSI